MNSLGYIAVSQTTLDEAVNEAEGERMVLNHHRVKVVEEKIKDSLDNNGVVLIEEKACRI